MLRVETGNYGKFKFCEITENAISVKLQKTEILGNYTKSKLCEITQKKNSVKLQKIDFFEITENSNSGKCNFL